MRTTQATASRPIVGRSPKTYSLLEPRLIRTRTNIRTLIETVLTLRSRCRRFSGMVIMNGTATNSRMYCRISSGSTESPISSPESSGAKTIEIRYTAVSDITASFTSPRT